MTTPANAILVGYDGSADSQRALTWAIGAAQRRDRPLHVLVAEGAVSHLTPAHRERREQAAAGLEGDVRDLVGMSLPTRVTTQIAEGSATPALLAAAEQASLVVVGARGHSVVAGTLIGSVSQHVAQHAPCSVVVVRQAQDLESSRIVVGVDGSVGSDRALAFAFDHASRAGAPLMVVYAWQMFTSAGEAALTYDSVTIQQEFETGERLLAESLAGWSEKYPDVAVTERTIPLYPPRALADASEHAALVVVGSRGRGAFRSLLLGSVSQAVLHHAHCSVAIAR